MESPDQEHRAEDRDDLRQQIAALTNRVYRLEQRLIEAGLARPEVTTSPAAPLPPWPQSVEPPTQIPGPVTALGSIPPPQGFLPPPPSFRSIEHESSLEGDPSLEARIGSQIFNRIGIVALLIAMAWFLKFAFDNHWIGPLGRVIVGLIVGVGLIVWSERFRRRGYPPFSYSLKAVGSGTLYLSLWAAFQVYHLMPAGAAFGAMILVTAWNGFMAWVQDAELLALYAIVGGLSTPLLVSTGENHELVLFSYLLVLDLAVVVLIALKPWARLVLSAFLGTVLFWISWGWAFYGESHAFALTAWLTAIFFLLFAVASRLLHSLREERAGNSLTTQENLVVILLPLANAAYGFLSFYALLDAPGRTWARPWVAVLFAGLYLLLLRAPLPASLRPEERSPEGSKPGLALLSGIHLTLAVVFLTIAIPLEAQGRWITVGWLVEGAALLWVARRFRSLLLRALGVVTLLLGCFGLFGNLSGVTTVLFNARFATFLVAIAVFSFAAWLGLTAEEEAEGRHEYQHLFAWREIAGGSVLLVNGLLLVAVGFEIHTYWWLRPGQVWNPDLFSEYHMYAQFTYSAWFMLFGAALLAVGFWRHKAFLRWQALALLVFSVGKVFTVDLSQLTQGYRILSFLALGVLLLSVSFAYQKDWLGLRTQALSDAEERRREEGAR